VPQRTGQVSRARRALAVLTSGHRKLGHASYANSEGCQGCHTHEGFVERVKRGKVDPKAVVANPSEIGCFTCHAPHEKGDFSLRTEAKLTLTNGVVIDKGKSNLCASCHRVLYVTKNEVYELPGRKYSSSAHATLPKADCVTCHMSLPDRRYALEPAIGGHSFNVGGVVHGAPKLNNAGCLGAATAR
jgi:hypothetical protein